MHNLLNLYFPAIRQLEDIISDIQKDGSLKKMFNEWSPERRMHFVDICTGRRGVRMLYDPFLQEMMRSCHVRDAMERCLSDLSGRDVTIKRLFMEGHAAPVLMECIVDPQCAGELHSIRFMEKEDFIPDWDGLSEEENVLMIILLENTPVEFQSYRKEYMYYGFGRNGSEAAEKYSAEYCIFCHDRFQQYIGEKGIQNMTDAWWTFLVCDAPDLIVQLIIKYPFFIKIYKELYRILSDTGRALRLTDSGKPQTDCGKKCARLIRTERLLEEQKLQITFQVEQIEKMQETIDKQAYIISEQCRE